MDEGLIVQVSGLSIGLCSMEPGVGKEKGLLNLGAQILFSLHHCFPTENSLELKEFKFSLGYQYCYKSPCA